MHVCGGDVPIRLGKRRPAIARTWLTLKGLVSYILFFIILWFTWLQTTLYDIRFAVDSVYERAAKIVHFGVMIGFAATTLAWNPLDPKLPNAVINLRAMGLTLVASRFAFGLQYGVAAGFSFKHQRKGLIPLIIHSVSMFGAAGGYLGVRCSNVYIGYPNAYTT